MAKQKERRFSIHQRQAVQGVDVGVDVLDSQWMGPPPGGLSPWHMHVVEKSL